MKNLRLLATLSVAILLSAIIYLVAPQQLPVILYKLSMITIAGVAGYWLDRELFPYARPDSFLSNTLWELSFCTAQLRRAIIVGACIIGVGLGA